MKVAYLVLVLVFVLFGSAFGREYNTLLGSWTPIKNLSDPHVKEIADYAVTEYDKRSGEKLKLEKVIKGESQVVAGTNYRLTLAATDGSSSNNYVAIVWEKPWLHFRNLTSFTPVHS